VDLAVFARRLGVLRASFQPFQGVRQQILAIGTQLAFRCLMFAVAVDMHKLSQDITIFFPLVHNAPFLIKVEDVYHILQRYYNRFGVVFATVFSATVEFPAV